MACEFKLLIGGIEREGAAGASEPVLNPATAEPIGHLAHATAQDVDDALAAATQGQREWQAVPPWQRGRIMKTAADHLRRDAGAIARVITREQGKPLAESREEVERSADFLEWGGEEARRVTGRTLQGRDAASHVEIETHPIGVVAAFTPWNFPLAQAAKKFAGALGAGCAVICKPAQETPGAVIALARALLEAGLPPAAVSLLFGDAGAISTQLIQAPAVAKISFTGSIPVGKLLAAAAGQAMKPVTMELGGHAPMIVCGDVDPERAADQLARAKFKNAGQICLSPSRFFVEERIAARFAVRLAEHARAWRVGDGLDPQTQMGPLASERRLQAVSRLVEDARSRGATLLAGGQRLARPGFFLAPTVITDVPPDAAILHEEPFGPVAPILPFRSEQAMLDQANGLPFGLSAYVMTGDPARQRRLANALQYGAVGINEVVTHHPEVPLGGWKDSGIGTEGGTEMLAPYQKTKFVSVRRG